MESDARRAVVSALIDLGRSHDVNDRADAGHGLARFAENSDAERALIELLLDREDTFVTLRTAEALSRRRDAAGLRILAAALAIADDNHADWVSSAVVDVFGIYSDDLEAARRICEQIVADAAQSTRAGAVRLRAILAEISPVLRPA